MKFPQCCKTAIIRPRLKKRTLDPNDLASYSDLTYKCLHGLAPDYLSSFCVPLSTVTGRSHFRSADGFQLLVPRTRTVTLEPRAFCSSGPVSWNTLPVGIRDPNLTLSAFRQQLKTFLFDI